MPEFRSSIDAQLRDEAVRCRGNRQRFLPGLVLFGLMGAAAALAGEQSAMMTFKVDPAPVNFGAANFGAANFGPMNFDALSPVSPVAAPSPVLTMPTSGGVPIYSTTEFRPRKHTIFDRDPAVSAFSDAPMLHYATVWQRLSEYKSRDRVRLLTLWESSGSSVSLQAGKRGDPSLQWTSRLMNRGGSTRGLLDRFFSVSLAGAANGMHNSGLHNSARLANEPVASKPAAAAMVAGLK